MKRALEPLRAVLICSLILAAVAILAFRLSHVEKNIADCSTHNSTRTVSLTAENSTISLDTTSAEQCAILLVQNLSSSRFALAFGNHDEHYPYAGYEEQTIRPGESLRLTLSETGTFSLHNHYDESQEATLTIY